VAPNSLTTLAWVYLGVCFVCAGVIAYDILVNHRRQPMGVMDAVFPITALYFGPFALALYLRWGRAGVRPRSAPSYTQRPSQHPSADATKMRDPGPSAPSTSERPWWATMAIEVSHCGAGCTLGDLIAEWVIFALALTIAGYALFAEYVGDYLLALAFGIAFQYFAIAPMRGLGLREGLKAAARADFISLTCFEIGLFGWMALMAFVFFPAPHHLMPISAAYWFLMQIGMIIGYLTSWPANVWLVKRGIKVPM
jgi:hypothetical protein